MDLLRGRGLAPEESGLLVMSLLLHRLQFTAATGPARTLDVWASGGLENPTGTVDKILREAEQAIAPLPRVKFNPRSAGQLLQIIHKMPARPRTAQMVVEYREHHGGQRYRIRTVHPRDGHLLDGEDPGPTAGTFNTRSRVG